MLQAGRPFVRRSQLIMLMQCNKLNSSTVVSDDTVALLSDYHPEQ